MGVLERLRYLFEVERPRSQQFLVDFVNILFRFARHSSWACQKIVDCPRLLHSVIAELLPLQCTWKGDAEKTVSPVYGVPYWGALKLLRLLAAADKQAAKLLVCKFKAKDIVSAHVLADQSSSHCSLLDSCQLCIESYRLWTVCLCYGFLVDFFNDIFEVVLEHIRSVCRLDIEKSAASRQFTWDRAAVCAVLVEKIILLHGSAISERQLVGLVEVLESCLGHVLNGVSGLDTRTQINESLVDMLGAVVNCVAACEMHVNVQRKKNHNLETVSSLFWSKFILPRINSALSQSLLNKERWKEQCDRDPDGMPTLRSVNKNCTSLHECICPETMFPLLVAWCRYLFCCKSLDLTRERQEFVHEKCVGEYLERAVRNLELAQQLRLDRREKSIDWFAKQETYLILWICFLRQQLDKRDNCAKIITGCLQHFHSGQEALALNLIETFCSDLPTNTVKSFKWVLPKKDLDNSAAQVKVAGFPVSNSVLSEEVTCLCQNRTLLLVECAPV